jgi:ABC-type branched-subunit amino acid transport system substrate-binding protein
VAAVVAGVAVAACGSSSSGSRSAASSSPVKIMAMGQIQAATFSMPGIKVGAEAAVNRLNAAGGIDGHKIDLISCNDNGNPNGAAACARQAVQDHVAAVVGEFTQYGDNVLPLLRAAGIPSILPNALAPDDYTSSNAFDVITVPSAFPGPALALANSGCKRIGVIADDVANSHAGLKLMQLGAQAGGATLVPVYVPPTAQEFSGPVSTLLSQGVQCITFSVPPEQAAPAIVAIRQTGKPVKIAALTTIVPDVLLKALKQAGNGVIGLDFFYPSTYNSSAVQQMVSDVKKVDPSVAPSEAVNSYAAVMVFAQAAKNLSTITPQALTQHLSKLSNVQTGLTQPLDFAKLPLIKLVPRAAATQMTVSVARNGEYFPTGQTIDVLKAFGQ